ncbi:MAG: GWxTD domain-containing protein [Candidatus Aminicenantes bacterium]|nr:MAG: GWxTD domain-containing protein [Candidatus Aminicenantes bacterium]
MNLLPSPKKNVKLISLLLGPLLFLSACFFLFFFSSSCRLYKLEQQLDSVNAEFLSKVRFIITKKERKIFLELPDSEKEKFKEEFWERRDPNPETEENEFKMEYFSRIEQSDELFLGEGRPGWLTDRGRIYILFGSPQYRETHRIESSDPSSFLYRRCGEIWHYGGFPVVFVDSTCTGSNYRLVTYNLTGLRSINLMYMHELNRAQDEAQKTFEKEKGFFDFNLRIEKTIVEVDRIEGIIVLEIPYAVIWYKAEEDWLKTTIDVLIELKDFEGRLIWEYNMPFEIGMKEEELKERQNKNHRIEIPLILEKGLGRLRQGKSLFHIFLKNRTGGEELKKVMEFKI